MKTPDIFIHTFVLLATIFASTGIIEAGVIPSADSLTFSHISIKDGLSQSTVLSACQDTKGQMWFATRDGLNRYDGYSFTIYRHNAGDERSISDNIIRKVYLDDNGSLWIGTEKGLSLYDSAADSFYNFPTSGHAVTGISYIKDNTLLIAAGGGLRLFDMKSKEWIVSAPPQST